MFYLFHWIYVIYLYHIIFKSCLTFIVIIFLLSQINGYIISLFLTFSLSFLSIFLLINLSSHNYSSSNIFLLLTFYFLTTLYLNLTIPQSIHIPFILTLLLLIFFFTINICFSLFHSIYILPTQTGEYSLPLFFLLVNF